MKHLAALLLLAQQPIAPIELGQIRGTNEFHSFAVPLGPVRPLPHNKHDTGEVQVVNPPPAPGYVNVVHQSAENYGGAMYGNANPSDSSGYEGVGQVGEWIAIDTRVPIEVWEPDDVSIAVFSYSLDRVWTTVGVIGVQTEGAETRTISFSTINANGTAAFFVRSLFIPEDFPVGVEVFMQHFLISGDGQQLKALSNVSRITTQEPLP